jgi:hypothetical protein
MPCVPRALRSLTGVVVFQDFDGTGTGSRGGCGIVGVVGRSDRARPQPISGCRMR